MSLAPRMVPPVPEETAEVARAAFPKGNVYLQMRDEFGSIYTDGEFADLYPRDGVNIGGKSTKNTGLKSPPNIA